MKADLPGHNEVVVARPIVVPVFVDEPSDESLVFSTWRGFGIYRILTDFLKTSIEDALALLRGEARG